MRETGIVRRIDDLGRIVIPRAIREQLNIKNGEAFEISIDSQTRAVMLTPIKKTIDIPLSYYIDTHEDILNEKDKASLQRLERFAKEHNLYIKIREEDN